MARFITVLTHAGAAALTEAMHKGEKIFPDFVTAGEGRFSGDPAAVTELVSPLNADIKITDREFIRAEGESPPVLKITAQTSNEGITKITPIREILLYANSSGGTDMTNAVPFAYARLDGEDTDNVLSPPIVTDRADAHHFHELALFVTNQQAANIEVRFAFNGFVTHGYLNELPVSNKNILHNWDFRNPVNQRRRTEYSDTKNIYTIDRWRFIGADGLKTLTLGSGFVTFEASTVKGSSAGIGQLIEFPENYTGSTLTFSIKYRTLSDEFVLGFDNTKIPPSNDFSVYTKTFTPISESELLISLNTESANAQIDIESVKLEFGSVSTLAKDPPMDFGKELTVCQRYQAVFSGLSRLLWLQSNFYNFACPLNVPIRVTPTLVMLNDSSSVRMSPHPYAGGTSYAPLTEITISIRGQAAEARLRGRLETPNPSIQDSFLNITDCLIDANL
jgi:hypothetical protein